MIRFACPACKSVFETPDDKAGRKTTCPKCRQRLQVPSPTIRPPRNKTVLGSLLPPVPGPPPAVSAPAVSDTSPPVNTFTAGCPFCGLRLYINPAWTGGKVRCPKCKAEFVVNTSPVSQPELPEASPPS